jgi:type I restriction enzyme S subunit
MSLNLDKSSWSRVTFGDVVCNVNETVRDAAAVGIDRVIAMEHMDPGELQIQRWGSPEDGTTFTRRVRPGQTLFAKRRAYQRKVAYADFDAICSGDILTFEADETQLLLEFLPFLVQSNEFFDHALGTSVGSLSPRTNWRDLANFEFDLPPLDEQKRIAVLIWTVENHRLALHLEAERAKEVLRLLRNELINNPAVAMVPAGQAFDILIGRQRSPGRAYGQHMTGYLRSANVSDGRLELDDVLQMDFTPEEQVRFGLEPGDVLVSEGSASENAVGANAVWHGNISGPICFQNTLLRYRAVSGKSIHGFVEHWCKWAYQSGAFREAASGTNILHIGAGRASAMPVRLPDISAQRRVVHELSAMEEAVAALTDEVTALTQLRSSILAAIFGGD